MIRFFDNDEWLLSPAGGLTGEAWKAESDKHKLFIKRNASPFLAVLSAEGIVPKLLWSRRTGNGDVLTAQEWMNGRVLTPDEMASKTVIALLRKIHSSEPLLSMMKKLGKKPVSAKQIFDSLLNRADGRTDKPVFRTAFAFLERKTERVEYRDKVVCHTDMNHNNWLLDADEERLYLVDWEQAVIADPAMDLSMLLFWYIPEDDWDAWLDFYGYRLTDFLRLRLVWYMIALTLRCLLWHQEHAEMKEVIHFQSDLAWLNDYAARCFPE